MKVLDRKKVFRFNIYSKDAISGDCIDGVYQLDVPDFIQDIGKYHVAVEECTLYTSVNPIGARTRTYIFETSMNVPDSYSTSTKSSSQVLFQMTKANSVDIPALYSKPITTRTYGIPLSDVNFLRNKQFRIVLKNAADLIHSEATFPIATSGWCMTLIVYPFVQE